MTTTTELTNNYIKEHPSIKSCLKKGLINYSSLSRLIAKDLKIQNKTSKDAILIAARRYHQKLKQESNIEKKVRTLLSNCEIEIKNRISVFILEKNLILENFDSIEREVRKSLGSFYILEGSISFTIVIPERHDKLIKTKFKGKIIKERKDLSLLVLKTPPEIEDTKGSIAYLTSLFAENDVNIVEFLSCYTDTLFIIDSKDVSKALEFLKF